MKTAHVVSLVLLVAATALLIVFLTRKTNTAEKLTESESVESESVINKTDEKNQISNKRALPERDARVDKERDINLIMSEVNGHIERRANNCGRADVLTPEEQHEREERKKAASREYEQQLRASLSDDELGILADLLKDPLVQQARSFADDDIGAIESLGGWGQYEKLEQKFKDSIGGAQKYEALEPDFHVNTLPFSPDKNEALNDVVDATMRSLDKRAFFDEDHFSTFAKNSQMRDDRLRVTISMAMAYKGASTEDLQRLVIALSLPEMQQNLVGLMNFNHRLCEKFISPPVR